MDPFIKTRCSCHHVRRESFGTRKTHVLYTMLGFACLSLLIIETEGSGMIEKLVRRGNNSINGTTHKINVTVPSSSSNSVIPVKHSSKFTLKPENSFSSLSANSTEKVTTSTSISSSVSVKSTSTTSPNPKTKGTDTNEKQNQQKREVLLPLEKLFPTVSSKLDADISTGSPTKTFESMKVPSRSPISNESPEEKLKSALLNHSLHINDMDKGLDQLVFSQLPEGSKLILKSVKIVRTDEDGNEHDEGNEATTWDIVPNNGTSEDFLSDEDIYETTELSDLISAGSHPKTRSQYDSHGSNHRTKQRDSKYHNNRNHGKHNAQTFTDTEGTKAKKYEGTEKGLTDFVNEHGNAQSNEGGRYKDSKKKNKGRKVTGFKRVYHKEEFQRTEHFYDDEEAKRIAENFGANDNKEKSSHGLKNDDRKYHGTYREHTDGQKVKNEHGTTNNFNKGHHETHKESERHQQGHQRSASSLPGHSVSGYEHSNANSNHRQPQHDGRKYQGAYSTNTDKKVPSAASTSTNSGANSDDADDKDERHVPSSSPLNSQESDLKQYTKAPTGTRQRRPGNTNSEYTRQRQLKASASSHENGAFPSVTMRPPQPLLAKPSEMKVFFSPRERFIPYYSKDDITMAYAPNFGPNSVQGSHTQPQLNLSPNPNPNHNSIPSRNPMSYGYSYRTIHPNPSKQLYGFKVHNDSYSENSQNPRYAVNFASGNGKDHESGADPIPTVYSTLVKTLPGQYGQPNITEPAGNLISIQKSNGREVSSSSISTSVGNSISNLDSLSVPTTKSATKDERHKNGQGSPIPIPNQKLRQQQPQQITWVPLTQTNNNHHPHYPGPLVDNRPHNGPKYLPTNLPLNHLRIGKTLIPTMYIRHPSTTVPVTNRRPGPPMSAHGPGPIGYNNAPGQPSTVSYNAVRKNPQFSNFMNGLMDSVAGFFGRIG